ncbi:MAG: hypothetical protein BHW12_04035 [Coprobacillus sp. 28_7]|nr:MAG: hypothetical protein BHW12_04035 [Coprobacillus sp. 28_7]
MKEKIRSYFTKDRLKAFLFIAIGVMIAAFSYSFFLKPNEIVIGGVSGIGVIVSGKSDIISCRVCREPATRILFIVLHILFLQLCLTGYII